MKLLLENWRKYQLLTEAQDIHALYESGQITEAEFMDKLKRFARKKGIPLAVALSLATGAVGGAAAQTQKAWQDYEQDVATQTQEEPGGTYVTLQDLRDYPMSPAPEGVKPGFVYVQAGNIPDSADLGPNSPYKSAGNFREAVKTNPIDVLKNQLVGKDSGAIFGSGDSAYFVEWEQTEDGKNILPLEWSLTYEAFLQKAQQK
tara:strand:+ start:1056 stop:1664 length:609 start_codon:yes stop_codon:yes gene_type:complete